MNLKKVIVIIFLIKICIVANAFSLDFYLRGELSGWAAESRVDEEWKNQLGIRYIPQLTLESNINDSNFLDFEVSSNGYYTYNAQEKKNKSEIELYRLKFRFTTPQTETRIGLQKINFGTAQLLRSLKWFDKLDPRDPQKLTDGIYALLFRYYALSNANVWLWGLYGNDEVKGLEIFPSVKDEPEFGGRFQYPVFTGELAISGHTRMVNAPILKRGNSKVKVPDYRENRFALDGHWDIGIGLWGESVLQQFKSDFIMYKWIKYNTIGMDYTISIGNGIYVLIEHMVTVLSEEVSDTDESGKMSTFSLSYPVGLFDNFQAIGYYSWDLESYYQYYSWSRTYDSFSLNLSGFHYPQVENVNSIAQASFDGGYGVQMMMIYYH